MYKIQYARSVLAKDLPKLKSANLLKQFLQAVEKIKEDPFIGKQLTGPLKGKRSVRINLQHRVFYVIYQEMSAEDDIAYQGYVNILQAFGHDLK